MCDVSWCPPFLCSRPGPAEDLHNRNHAERITEAHPCASSCFQGVVCTAKAAGCETSHPSCANSEASFLWCNKHLQQAILVKEDR